MSHNGGTGNGKLVKQLHVKLIHKIKVYLPILSPAINRSVNSSLAGPLPELTQIIHCSEL